MEEGLSSVETYCEEFGSFFERIGLPRMAGRVFGLLIIAEPPYLSAGELEERLGASKGSISETTRLLLHLGFIEVVTLPKERRRYFRIKVESAYKMLEDQIDLFSQLRRLMEMGATLVSERNMERRKQMEDMVHFFSHFEEKLKHILHMWKERYEGRRD